MDESTKTYFEDLDVDCPCPHDDAFVPDGEKVYYRKLKANSEIEQCFVAPPFNEAVTDRADACVQKSLSVFDDLDTLINAVIKIQAGKKKTKKIAVLMLTPNDGVLKQTFGKNHHSWWRSHAFNVANVTIHQIVL